MSDIERTEKHKFQKDFVQTYEEAFIWRFDYYIEIMLQMAKLLGRDKLLDLIKNARDNCQAPRSAKSPDFSFTDWIVSGEEASKNTYTWDVIEKTDKIYEIRITECLWTKIFRERNAADIGYATICHGDFASARSAHPKLRLERTKILMQGDDCCNHRWILDD
jgi:hypothetical protein